MDASFRPIIAQMAELAALADQESPQTEKRQSAAAAQAERITSEMRQIFSALKEPLVLVSKKGFSVLANPAAKKLLDLDPVGRPIEKVVEKLKLTRTGGRPVTHHDLPIKYALDGYTIIGERFSFIDRNNTTRFFSISSYPLILDKAVHGAVVVLHDETERSPDCLKCDLARESSALKAIFDSAPEAIVVADENCRIIMSNPKARWLYDQQNGKDAEVLMRKPEAQYADEHPNDIITLPLGRTVFRKEVISDFEMAVNHPGRPVKHILVNTSPILDQNGNISGGVGIFHDITERKLEKLELQRIRQELEKRVALRTRELSETIDTLRGEIKERERIERRLRYSEAALKRISKKMLDTLEADRKTIAKELHDSIGASLAAIKFSLEEKLAKMTSTPPDDLTSLENIVSHLMDMIKETKRISANLRPSTMDDLGLAATVSWFCREFKTFYKNIEIKHHIDIDESDTSDSMKIVIYRILQEAMNNAAKHGQPTRIDLTLKKNGDGIYLAIGDDGVGFEPGDGLISSDPLSGHGIVGMKERAEICGGTFKIAPRPGGGTMVEVIIPVLAHQC